MATFGFPTGVGTTVSSTEIENDSIVNADINSAAAIVDTKLDTIATAGKVDGAALTLLANIPAGAGLVPAANIPAGTVGLATTNLSAADIISMFTTPIQLVAGVAGQIVVVHSIVVSFTYGGTQFTGGGSIRFYEESSTTGVSAFLASSAVTSAANFLQSRVGDTEIARVSGKGVVITNSTGAFATGNGTMKIIVAYSMATI